MAEISKPYIDIHSHGNANNYPESKSDHLSKYKFNGYNCTSNGEQEIITVRSLRLSEFEMADHSPFFSIGIYPFDAETATIEDLKKLEELAPEAFAIGEIGLDYREQFRDFATIQKEVFRKQILIANKCGKPIIIHQVRALDDVLEILTATETPVIFHGFSGSAESARRILSQGSHYLSFGHLILNNEKAQRSLAVTPVEKLFLETDESDCTIEQLYRKTSEILGIPVEKLINQIEQNFRNVGDLARENRTFIR